MWNLHPWPDYIIRKCFFLSGVQLASALILSVWAGARPDCALHLRHYIAAFQTASLIVMATGLFGGLFLEDILRKSR